MVEFNDSNDYAGWAAVGFDAQLHGIEMFTSMLPRLQNLTVGKSAFMIEISESP